MPNFLQAGMEERKEPGGIQCGFQIAARPSSHNL